jgi:hypothetical protein
MAKFQHPARWQWPTSKWNASTVRDAEQPDDGPTCYMHGGRPPKRGHRYRRHMHCAHVGPDGRRCMMRVDTKGRVREIEGSHVEDVLRAYAGVRPEAQLLRQSPWVSGSFYVALFLVVISALLVVARILPVWAVPVIMVDGLLGVSILGAFQLRHDEKLTERGFLRLMLVAVRTLPVSATAPAPGEQQR